MRRRVLVTGSRRFSSYQVIAAVLDAELEEHGAIIVIHGAAPGADSLAALWAERHHQIQVRFPADWERDGRAAGPIRNRRMVAANPDIVHAFPLGESRGTRDCVAAARAAGLEVRVHTLVRG